MSVIVFRLDLGAMDSGGNCRGDLDVGMSCETGDLAWNVRSGDLSEKRKLAHGSE